MNKYSKDVALTVVGAACAVGMIALAISIIKDVVIVAEPSPPVEGSETVDDKSNVKYFNTPLNTELQDRIFEVCKTYEFDPAMVIAMIEQESNGLMLIEERWHQARMARLGVTDLLDPHQNVLIGVDYLSELCYCDNGIEWALMAYAGGYSFADKMLESGVVSDYANDILERANELNREFIEDM